LNLLAKIPELRVIARTSSFAYKGKDVKIADVAKELNVGHVLEGSVRKAGNQVRITAQLIRSSDSSHLWSESFDRSLDNIFLIQDEIAQAVINQLKITLLGDAPKALQVDPEAYALFLQARHFGNLGTDEGLIHAEQLLQQVLEIAPLYSAAWSELGRNWQNKASSELVGVEMGYAKAEECQNKALELDPSNGVAYSRLGFDSLHHEWDWPAAAQLFEKALAFEPGNAVVLANAASMALALGRLDQTIALRELALQLDPLNAANAFGLGVAYYFNDQPELAETTFRKTLSLSPNRPITRAAIVRAMFKQGDYQNTDEIWELIAEEPYEPFRLVATTSIHYKSGNFIDADIALEALIEKWSGKMDALIAVAYAIRGNADEAIGWLQQAVDSMGPQAILNARHAPEYDFIHDDPRWQELLTKAGLSEEQVASIEFDFQLPE
jgi:tetratricopeptide (TPR) repeat protein